MLNNGLTRRILGAEMHKVEIRQGVWLGYEDNWFGKPWTQPNTVVMVHGNCESSRAWTQWVPYLAGTYRVIRPDLPGFGASTEPPNYHWTVGDLPQTSCAFWMRSVFKNAT